VSLRCEAGSLEVRLGGRTALGPLDLDVRAGEFFVVAGPNGSGKSTLLRALAGLAGGYAGSLRLGGEEVRGMTPARLASRVCLLHQFPPQDVPFAVEEVVLMGRSPHQGFLGLGSERDLGLARQAMARTGILDLRRRPLASLSGGEARRAWLAQAICREPELFLLDEPTASLDPGHQALVMDLLRAVRAERGCTMVVVSHDLNLASVHAERLLLLKGGRAMALGTPDETLTEANLARAYDWEMAVDRNPFTGSPRVTPRPAGA